MNRCWTALIVVLCLLSIAATDVFSQNIQINDLEFLDQKTSTQGEVTPDTSTSKKKDLVFIPQPEDISPACYIFGGRCANLHASLQLSEEYTDNLYNVQLDKQESFLTRIAPAVWFSLPKLSRVPIHIGLNKTSIGGVQFSQPDIRFQDKYLLYIHGDMDYKIYSANSSLNTPDVSLTGLFQYRPGKKLTFDVTDKFKRNQDMFNITDATADNPRTHNSNLFNSGAEWQFSKKFSARLDYTFFNLAYVEDINRFLDRMDNGVNFRAFYNYSRKTKFFLQYRYMYSSYPENDLQNNANSFLYGGVDWQYSVKTTLMAKVGQQITRYDKDDAFPNSNNLTFEVQMNWRLAVRTSLLFEATYGLEQSGRADALNKQVLAARAGYQQQLTNRIRASIDFMYENSDYDQLDNSTEKEKHYFLQPRLEYAFKKWLHAELSYSYDMKDAEDNQLDYDSNSFRLAISGSF